MNRRFVMNALLVVCAVGLGLALSVEPWRVYMRQKTESAKQAGELRSVEERRAADLKLASEIESPAGRERTAREHGYHKPNEVPLEGIRP